MAMAEIAITSLYVVTYSSWKRRSPSGTVLSSSWVTTMSGQTNASHVSRQVKIARVRIAGHESGTTMRK